MFQISKHKADNKVSKPFSQTNFGRLPPEIRAKVFIELLATPPPYAGHDFATESPETRTSSLAPKKFVHIKASWYQVTRTCRQIFTESHPIFFASKSYYFEKPQELARFLEYDSLVVRQIFQWDNITALCLKDCVTYVPLYTKERIDNIFSDPSTSGNLYVTRAGLEAMTYKRLELNFIFCIKYLRNIKTIGFCMRVGEELSYIDLLYWVSGMRRGLVEFVDASHWIIRPQNPEDAWSIQYACFGGGDFGKGKDNEDIPYDRRRIESEVTDIDSRIPGLQEGDERYVEVQIRRPFVESLPQESFDSDEDDTDSKTASSPRVDLFSRHSDEAPLEAPQDQAEDDTLADTSDHEDLLGELESDSDGNQSLLDGRGLQTATDRKQEDDHGLIQPAYGSASATQLNTECDHQAERPPLSSPVVSMTHDASTGSGNDPLSLNSNDENVEVQTDPTTLKHTVHDLQNDNDSLAQIKTEADETQQNLKDEVKGQRRSAKPIYLSKSSKQPLLDIVDTPNPYTEEEMEWYQNWQDGAISGTQQRKERVPRKEEEEEPTPSFGKMQKHHVEPPLEAAKTATPQQQRPTTASQSPPGLLIRYLQAGILFLLSLILAILTRPAKQLSDASRDTKVPSQQQ